MSIENESLTLELLNDDCLRLILINVNLREQYILLTMSQKCKSLIMDLWYKKYKNGIDLNMEFDQSHMADTQLMHVFGFLMNFVTNLRNLNALLLKRLHPIFHSKMKIFPKVSGLTYNGINTDIAYTVPLNAFPNLERLNLSNTRVSMQNLIALRQLTDLQLKYCTFEDTTNLNGIFQYLHLKCFTYISPDILNNCTSSHSNSIVTSTQTNTICHLLPRNSVHFENVSQRFASIACCNTLNIVQMTAKDLTVAIFEVVQLPKLKQLLIFTDNMRISSLWFKMIIEKLLRHKMECKFSIRFKCDFDIKILEQLENCKNLYEFCWQSNLNVLHNKEYGIISWQTFDQRLPKQFLKFIQNSSSLEKIDLRRNCHANMELISIVQQNLQTKIANGGKAVEFLHDNHREDANIKDLVHSDDDYLMDMSLFEIKLEYTEKEI